MTRLLPPEPEWSKRYTFPDPTPIDKEKPMTRRQPSEYNWATCDFDERILPASPRRITSPRRDKIWGVTVHHMAMVGKAEAALTACSNAWKTREASAHYGVADGFVRQYVWDNNEAWACANGAANRGTISIEHANSGGAPGWEVSEATWRTGAKLVAALHVFHKLGRPVDGVTKNHVRVSGTLFQHKDWFSTACAGPYLGGKIWAKYVAEAQHQYDLMTGMAGSAPPPVPPKPYTVQRGDTLSSIARKFGVTTDQLVKWNGIKDPNRIEVGQRLRVSA